MMRKALLIGGATSSIIFPQYVVNSWPNLFLALTLNEILNAKFSPYFRFQICI